MNNSSDLTNYLTSFLSPQDIGVDDLNTYSQEVRVKRSKLDLEYTDSWCDSLSILEPGLFSGNPQLLIDAPISIVEFYDLFLHKSIVEYIINLTNLNIVLKNKDASHSKKPPLLTLEEFYTYFSVLMILGLNNQPDFTNCWNKTKTFSYNSIMAQLMSLKRFQEINQYITAFSSDEVKDLKAKKKPKIVETLEGLFNRIYIPGENLALEEGVMAFKGKIKNGIYTPIKVDDWVMKFHTLADCDTGFVMNLRIEFERTTISETVNSIMGKYFNKNRKVYLDGYYNSFNLAEELLKNGVYVCGTLGLQRGGPVNLQELKKDIKGDALIFFQKENSQVLIWNEKKPTAMLTTCHQVDETIEDKEGDTIPLVVESYNKSIDGVDNFIQVIKDYNVKRKTHGWIQQFSLHILEILVRNSYVLYKKCTKEKVLLHEDFIERLIKLSLSRAGKTHVIQETKTIHESHLIIKANYRSNCFYCYNIKKKRSTTSYCCVKCKKHLCVAPCFYDFHSTAPKSDSLISHD